MQEQRRMLGRCAIAATVLVSLASRAEVSSQDQAVARSLFDQARALAQQGKHAEACPKLEESQRLDPGVGTLFNLADCYEHTGRTASAWSMFLQVASQSRAGGHVERERAARARAEALQPTLSMVVIEVPAPVQVSGLEIHLDGTLVGRGTWGTAVPVDRGSHLVDATAPGRKKWSAPVRVEQPGVRVSVAVPSLDVDASGAGVPAPAGSAQTSAPAAPAASAAASARPSESHARSETAPGATQRTVGLVAGGVGIAGIGVAVYFALRSSSQLSDAEPWCSGNQCWDQRGVDLHSDAVTSQSIARVAAGVGAAGLVGGALLYLTAPKGEVTAPKGHGSTTLLLGPGILVVKGAF
jgi:serine/threonine-protein kinase